MAMAGGSSNAPNIGKKSSRRRLLLLGVYVMVLVILLLWTFFLLSTFGGSKPNLSLTAWLSVVSPPPSPSPPDTGVADAAATPPPSDHLAAKPSSRPANLTARRNQNPLDVAPPQQFVKGGNSTSLGKEKDFDKPTPNTTLYNVPSPPLVHPSQPQDMLSKPIWDIPVASRMPDLKAFQLTKKMVEHRAQNNVIIVTFGNYAFMDFIVNWVRHLMHLNVSNFLIGAMDTKTLEALYWKGIPVFDMGSNMDTTDIGHGSRSPIVYKMEREKVSLVYTFLHLGYELLMCDADMVWLKNPLPYLAHFPEADLLISTDNLVPTFNDDSLEDWQQVTDAYNIGIFHWRPSDPAQRLARVWKDILLQDEKLPAQHGLDNVLQKVLGPSVEGDNGLVYAFDGSLKMGLLPSSIFCNGHTYFVEAMPKFLRLEPYAVHATFKYAGSEGKIHRLREAMLFYDQPEYYDSSGGFLSFKPRIPKSLLIDGPRTLESHFVLVNYQLKQIRNALAIASLLNRTLVMPPMWCKVDIGSSVPTGIYENTMIPLPFLCPLDHVMEINVMLSELPEIDFGPKIDFREYSFLQNPRLSKQVKESLVEVQLCDNRKCTATNEKSGKGVLTLPKNSNQEMLTQVLSKYKDVKVMHFSSMKDAFGGFTDKMMETKFRNRVKRYAGIWCCVKGRNPSHIYYDMYWDEKPNWKPEPPKSEADDQPPW